MPFHKEYTLIKIKYDAIPLRNPSSAAELRAGIARMSCIQIPGYCRDVKNSGGSGVQIIGLVVNSKRRKTDSGEAGPSAGPSQPQLQRISNVAQSASTLDRNKTAFKLFREYLTLHYADQYFDVSSNSDGQFLTREMFDKYAYFLTKRKKASGKYLAHGTVGN